MPTVREYELAFQKDPASQEPFVALRKAYRQAGKHDKLVTLYERRAQAIDDGQKAAELYYLAAELRIDQLGDAEGAEADLANAVDRDSAHPKATQRLKDIYREQNRTGDYMTMLEMEAGAVARTRDPGRLAELQNEMQQLFVSHFSRLERQLRNPQRPGRLTADNVKSIESARKIYRALGDFRQVVRLYELELEGTSDAKRRADLMLGLGRVLAEKLGELDAAAQRLGEVVRMRPRDEKALELLAGIYANPKWIGADGLERAAAIYYQVARRRHEAGDGDNAVAALRKALQAAPGHAEASELLERVYYDAQRFQDLDRYYRERVADAPGDAERVDFLFKRAQLAEGELGDQAEAIRVYEEIAAAETAGGPAQQRLMELYAEGNDFARLAELREKQLEIIDDPAQRIPIMNELASIYRDRLGDHEQAAVYLHAILEAEPGNAEALQAYSDHFREKGDWKALADLLEFSFDAARTAGEKVEGLVRRLEEIAGVCEKNLGDPERAIATWQRIEEIAPGYERARESQKRILQKAKQWDRMANVLEREAKNAADPAQRAEIMRRMAQIHREKLGDAQKAIAIYKDILRADPRDAVALRSLVEIYEREGDWDGLAKALRKQLEVSATKQEKISLLRRLLTIYDENLADLVEGSWAATEILKTVPGDRDALGRLESILERSDDPQRLVQTLEYHTRYAAAAEEKVQLVRRMADLLQNRIGDLPAAAEKWEQVARLAPDEGEALDALGAVYEKMERPAELARVLDMQIERLVDDPAAQAEFLRRLAKLADGALKEPRRAQRAWESLCEVLPADPEALEALSRIYGDKGDWGALVRVLERQIPLASEPAQAVGVALLRAQLLEEKLDDADAAAQALEQLIAEIDPRNLDAHQRLRRLYEARGDWARVVRVADRQLFLTEDPVPRAPLALEIAAIWRDRLSDQKKAITAYERVLEIQQNQIDALKALAPLYAAAGDSERLIVTDEKLLNQTEDPAERRRLMFEIARTCEEQMNEPRLAFEWFRRAYNDQPDAETLQLVDNAAETHGLWEELIQVYEGARARAREPFEQLAASLKIAVLCEEKLNDPARAFGVLRDALPSDPAGHELLPELERLANRTGDWPGLLDVYARVARGRPDLDDRVEVLRLRAGVREERMKDPRGAMDEYLRSFALQPTNDATKNEILRLADATGRWEDALKMQAQSFALAGDLSGKIEVARSAAALVEEKVKDPVRAFRAYLNAFRLAPDDDEIVGNLWRLAAVIGRYEELPPVSPTAAKALAAIDAPEAEDAEEDTGDEAADGARPTAVTAVSESGELSLDPDAAADSSPVSDEDVAELRSADLDEGEIREVSGVFEITDDQDSDEDEEVSEVGSGEIVLDELGSPSLRVQAGKRIRKATPPPPPPKAPPPPPPARRGAGSPFETPWEEFASAYEALPANDKPTRFGYLLKVAEIWEKGQKDIDRTVDALERAFKIDTTDETVRAELQRIATEHDEWDRVCDVWLGAVDEFGSIDRAVSLHHDVAKFREALGQIDKAEQRYRAILSLKPDYTPALDRMEEIHRDAERWADLAALLEKRTSGALEALPPGRERRQKYRELADLYEERLEKPYEAIDTLERYVGEAGDDERGADHGDVVDETVDAYEALARLYGKVGLYAKVVDTLQREVELVADTSKARDLRLRVAQIYEKELGLADRAVEAYEAVLSLRDDDDEALTALDRLHEAHGRFDALQDVLARRAELARPSDRTALVRRRAKILEEKLGNPEAAAGCLRDLGDEALRNEELTAALLRNLRRAGLAHEAARVLAQRLDVARSSGGADMLVSDLQLELGSIRLNDLGDLPGARAAIDAALKVTPERPAALAALGRYFLKQNDFAAFAETRVREAQASKGRPEAVAALLEAGRVYREQVHDDIKARECFESALNEDRNSGDALRSLAALCAAQGSWTEAKDLWARQLEIAETPQARAAVLTDIARAEWEGSGSSADAIKHLDEALALAPDHLPAVITMADIYYKEHQWDLAERRLNEALRRIKGQPEMVSRLHHRLAEVYDKLGNLEEGYRRLLEADRATPGQILIKLSLGENRFRARKWREAAMHLGALADHADAPTYPDEVAEGLSHGAQAEAKLRRPEKAIALYEAALRLRPDHSASIRALADLALERGDKREAAQHLRRMAEASGDRAERAQLFEQLGDLYGEMDDAGQARTCYEWALGMFETPGEGQAGLLEKTFKLQKSEGDMEAAARTAEALVGVTKDPKERAARRRQAASLLSERGESSKAASLLEQAVSDNPGDEGSLANLAEAYEKAGNLAGAEALLGRTLPDMAAPADEPEAKASRAALWEQLGRVRRPKDERGAIAAFEKAVDLDGGRVEARAALAALYGDAAAHADAALRNHRALLATDIARSDSLRALGRAYARAGQDDRARCCFEVLRLLGDAEGGDLAFLDEHPAHAMKPDDPYGAVLDDADRRAHLAHPEAMAMAEVFATIWEGAPGLIGQGVEEFGVGAQDKISPISDLDIGKVYGQIAKALGNKKTGLFVKWDPSHEEIAVAVHAPPALVIGPKLADGSTAAAMRFHLGRGLELTRPEYILAAGVKPKEFSQFFAGVLKAYHPRHSRKRAGANEAGGAEVAKLKKALPYKVSKRLVDLFGEMGNQSFSSTRWRQVVLDTGNRAGLLLCGELDTAARAVMHEALPNLPADLTPSDIRELATHNQALRELLQWAVSDDYFMLREKMGMATGAGGQPVAKTPTADAAPSASPN